MMRSSVTLRRHLSRLFLAVGVGTLVSACGGGTSQVQEFKADRMVAFGDETSLLTSTGLKYSVNALTEAKAVDCSVQPIWVQSVASLYGLVFAECNPTNVADPKATMAAAVGATVADLTIQVDAQIAAGRIGTGTLATVLVGGNDVLALYAQYPTVSEQDITTELHRRGALVAAQVNRMVGLDARVLIATIPDMGKTPYALKEKAERTDIDRAALLSRLTYEFNARIRTNIVNDGRLLGLVLADEMTQAMAKSPSSFSISNAVAAACTVALPNCTSDTLLTGSTSATWLWADDRRMAYGGQTRLASLATARARGNPF